MASTRGTARDAATGRTKVAGGRNRVRIIGGAWRSRIVEFPAGASLRPTPDRVRETLFNWLGQRLDGLRCLDLFAGSGVLGFEALSRGADHVVMVERDRGTVQALRAAGEALQAHALEIVHADALAWLARGTDRFDVAFVDPPYASALAVESLRALLPRMQPDGRVYVETGHAFAVPDGWSVAREGRAGAVRYALFQPATP